MRLDAGAAGWGIVCAMRKLRAVFKFGGPFLVPYWRRLAAGIALGLLFGAVNASFVWATRTMFNRLTPSPTGYTAVAGETNFHVFAVTNGQPAGCYVGNGPVPSNFIATNLDKEYARLLATTNGADSNIVVWRAASPGAPESPAPPAPAASEPSLRARGTAALTEFNHKVDVALDPWLPKNGRKPDWAQIIGGLLLLPVMIGIRGAIGYLSNYCLNWSSQKAVNDLRVAALMKINSLSVSYFNKSKIGGLLTQVNGDTAALQQALALVVGDLVKEPMTVICVLAALFAYSAKLTLFAIIFLPVCVLPIFILGRKIRRAALQSREANISQVSLLVEALSGIRVIKAFGLEQEQMRRFRKTCDALFHHTMKSVQARGLINPLIEVVAMLGFGVLLVYIVCTGVNLPDLITFLTGVIMLFEPIKKLAGIHAILEQTSVGVSRLAILLEEDPSVKEAASPTPLPRFESKITLEHVTFAYEPGKIVVEDINLEIPRGYRLGLAGESGSGKSTLVNLLMRFYDTTSGAVKIDGIDLRDIAFKDLRLAMALVSQEIVIFDQSVADNIGCGKKGATQADIEAAARAAFAHEFIMELPNGYQTVVGERGASLSGGQRQRLAIARAFVRGAPILILDEATASLDSIAEAEVQAAIRKLEENRTVICIAHRLSTLASMDRIVVLSKGQIVEQGSFNELIAAGGAFAAMARTQGITGKGVAGSR